MNKIGQYRYNSATEYMKISSIKTEYLQNSQTGVEDLAFYLDENTYFQESKMYYLNCTIECLGGIVSSTLDDGGIRDLVLKLITKDGKTEQYIQKFYYSNKNSTLEIIFSPRIKDAYYLVLELERTVRRDFNVNIQPRRLQADIDKLFLYEVNNILEFEKNIIPAKVINKIGIQGSNGALFSINGESIMLGQSGIYEITKDNFFITSLGISDFKNDSRTNYKDNNLYLIIDYYYDDMDEKEV